MIWSAAMGVIARCNGTLLVEDGDRLGVVEQGGGWVGTALFVTGLIALILAGNGIFWLTQVPALGAGLLAGAALAIAAAVALFRARRRRAAAPPAAPWLVFDLGAGALRDGAGATISPLDQVRIARAWQAGSSSKALVVNHRGGKVVVARGTPFGDDVDAIEHALRARGVRS